MSQFYVQGASGGSLPPTVPTEFDTQNGNAVPAGNILIVNGFDSTENNANGIITKGGVAGTGTANEVDVVLTNRNKVTATTSDGAGQTQTVTIFTPIAATGITFTVSFSGYDAANNEVTGGQLVGIGRISGAGAVVVVGTNDTFDESDAGLVSADWDIVTNGTVIQAQFVGVAGRSIAWSAVFIYDQSP